MSTRSRTPIAPGIFRDPAGFFVQARLGSAKTIALKGKAIRFPAGTDLGVLKAAHLAELAKLRAELNAWHQRTHGTVGPPGRGTLAADVALYFQTATLSAKTRAWRQTIFVWWVQQFPNRARYTLEPGEITRALNALAAVQHGHNKKTGAGGTVARQYAPASASTKNHYRTALYHLFTVLNGKNGSNPVRDVPKYDEGTPAAHDQPYEIIDAILKHIRDRVGTRPSLSKARLSVLAYVPVTPKQLYSLARRDVDLTRGTVIVPGRKKGAGMLPITKALTPEGIAAFRLFDAAAGWGKVASASSLQKAFDRAKRLAVAELRQTRPDLDLSTVDQMRPYHLRHSFATFVYQSTGDLDATRELLHHADRRTTERYAQGAVSARMQAANAVISAAFAARPGYIPPPPPGPRLVKRPR